MKKDKIIFWIATAFLFFVEGIAVAINFQRDCSIDIFKHLQYPDYFRVALSTCKLVGSLVIVIPAVPYRIKEWAYAGFTFNTLFAFISFFVIDGFGPGLIFPIVVMTALLVSYFYYHKLSKTSAK
jgi:hypothetical protein